MCCHCRSETGRTYGTYSGTSRTQGGIHPSEIRIHISGADQSLKQPDYAEGGLLYELMLENKKNNEQFSYSVWDMVLFEKAKEEKDLEVFFNTVMYDCETRMIELFPFTVYRKPRRCYQLYAGFRRCYGKRDTGYYAGAEYRKEANHNLSLENCMPPKPNNSTYRMGNSILLKQRMPDIPGEIYAAIFAKNGREEQQ